MKQKWMFFAALIALGVLLALAGFFWMDAVLSSGL